jgi:transcriptional regulator with XRE-family HTH domain
MILSERLKTIREIKNLSQGDIQERTGLLRCYISRVENGHTVPSIETLEKMARALEIPLYELFNDGDTSHVVRSLILPQPKNETLSSKDTRVLRRLGGLLSKMRDRDKRLLVSVAAKMASVQRWSGDVVKPELPQKGNQRCPNIK